MFLLIHFIVILYSLNSCVVLSFTNDEITSLPGLSHTPKFKQYSGYLNITKSRNNFYWLVESQNNPAKDPVIIWLNGGPECSSLYGLLGENGPFRVNKDGKTLVENIFSWNTVGNVVYLESPAGVGYSFDENDDYLNGDLRTANDSFLAVQSFYKKFPHFKNNSLYITGESYAGVYIPMLALEIFKRDPSIQLKGLALGNSLLYNSVNSFVDYAVGHGLVATDYVKAMNDNCCQCRNGTNQCLYQENPNPKCSGQMVAGIMSFYGDVNPFNILEDCPQKNGFTNHYKQISDFLGFEFDIKNAYEEDYYMSENECLSTGYIKYLNLPEVRKALHVSEKVVKWSECSDKKGNYTTDSDVMKKTMRPQIIELIQKYKIQNLIVYNGDLDTVVDFIGNQQFVDELGFKLTQKYKSWKVNGVTAGFIKRYEGITFMTVRGAGHMVPFDRPEAALEMIKQLIGISKVIY